MSKFFLATAMALSVTVGGPAVSVGSAWAADLHSASYQRTQDVWICVPVGSDPSTPPITCPEGQVPQMETMQFEETECSGGGFIGWLLTITGRGAVYCRT